jgi:hypothetical protein
VQAVLNAEQRAGACALAAEERRDRFGRGDGRGGFGGGGRGRGGMRGRGVPGMMDDSIGGRGFGGWPWCGEMRGRGMGRDSGRP